MRSSGLGLLPASHIKEVPMSALGQKQTSRYLQPMSALPPKADIASVAKCLLCAIRRSHTLYTRSVNWRNFIVELPAGHADFREIKGSDCAPGGRATLKQIEHWFADTFCVAEGRGAMPSNFSEVRSIRPNMSRTT